MWGGCVCTSGWGSALRVCQSVFDVRGNNNFPFPSPSVVWSSFVLLLHLGLLLPVFPSPSHPLPPPLSTFASYPLLNLFLMRIGMLTAPLAMSDTDYSIVPYLSCRGEGSRMSVCGNVCIFRFSRVCCDNIEC